MSRSKAEKLEFAKACERIEKRGGDVLAYVEREYPSYTPRATWYMLQREHLNRKQLTEGRPKENRGEKDMGKMMDMANEVMDAYARGENIYDWLEAHGYANASSTWFHLKQAAKKNDPELYARMCEARMDRRKPKESKPEVIPREPEEKPKEIPLPGETLPVTVRGKRITTCCAPARESGVTVPDEIPEETKKDDAFKKVAEVMKKVVYTGKTDPEPMEIVGVRSRVKGYYMKAEVNPTLANGAEYVHLIWRDLVTREERSIGLSVEDWKKLAEEIPQAMKQLGF